MKLADKIPSNHDYHNANSLCIHPPGPPEQTKEFLMAAAVAMKAGDWRKCVDLTVGVKVCLLFYCVAPSIYFTNLTCHMMMHHRM